MIRELVAMTCKNCGANVNRRTMKCDFCGTEYTHPNERIKFIVDRPGMQTIRCETRVDMEHMRDSPEGARAYVLEDMRQQLADGLLAFMKITTKDDYSGGPFGSCQIIRGEVRVVDPSFNY